MGDTPYHERLRALRIAKGWSQEQLSLTLGVPETKIERVEGGKYSIEGTLDILKMLNCPPTVEGMSEKEFQVLRGRMLLDNLSEPVISLMCSLMERLIVNVNL